jgi:type VI secretion system protein ImpA
LGPSDVSFEEIEKLFQEVSVEAPCGLNLEYDPIFLELERAIEGKPETQYGQSISLASPPDWKRIRGLALELLSVSRDLRVATIFLRALLNTQGISGLVLGLKLIEFLLEKRWHSFHPQLDAEDDNDPTLRLNILNLLAKSSSPLFLEIKRAPVIHAAGHGSFSLRDIEIATGELKTTDVEETPNLALIHAVCEQVELESLQAVCQLFQEAQVITLHIESLLTQYMGVTQALDLSELVKIFKRAEDFLRERLASRLPRAVATTKDKKTDNDTSSQVGYFLHEQRISSRNDVIKVLDNICAYYAHYEPSSPVPLLLQRAQALVMKNFFEIIEELAPEGLSQVYMISGKKHD